MAVPSRKDRVRPAELLLLSGGMALFAGLIVVMATRDITVSLVVLALVFIVVLVALAMLTLAARPTGDEQRDIDEQNSPHWDLPAAGSIDRRVRPPVAIWPRE